MNRYFFLLTGLLICCYVPINDVIRGIKPNV